MNLPHGIFHNYALMRNAENIINEFIESENCTVWIEDEEGNCFIPKGKIHVNYYEMFEIKGE